LVSRASGGRILRSVMTAAGRSKECVPRDLRASQDMGARKTPLTVTRQHARGEPIRCDVTWPGRCKWTWRVRLLRQPEPFATIGRFALPPQAWQVLPAIPR
jgi:hypothetical protein